MRRAHVQAGHIGVLQPARAWSARLSAWVGDQGSGLVGLARRARIQAGNVGVLQPARACSARLNARVRDKGLEHDGLRSVPSFRQGKSGRCSLRPHARPGSAHTCPFVACLAVCKIFTGRARRVPALQRAPAQAPVLFAVEGHTHGPASHCINAAGPKAAVHYENRSRSTATARGWYYVKSRVAMPDC